MRFLFESICICLCILVHLITGNPVDIVTSDGYDFSKCPKPIIHIKGYGRAYIGDRGDDKEKLSQYFVAQYDPIFYEILKELLKNGGTLSWDGDDYDEHSFTFAIPKLVKEIHSQLGENQLLLLPFKINTEMKIFMESKWSSYAQKWSVFDKIQFDKVITVDVSKFHLRTQSFWNEQEKAQRLAPWEPPYIKLGNKALELTGAKIILSIGGAIVPYGEYEELLVQYRNDLQNMPHWFQIPLIRMEKNTNKYKYGPLYAHFWQMRARKKYNDIPHLWAYDSAISGAMIYRFKGGDPAQISNPIEVTKEVYDKGASARYQQYDDGYYAQKLKHLLRLHRLYDEIRTAKSNGKNRYIAYS